EFILKQDRIKQAILSTDFESAKAARKMNKHFLINNLGPSTSGPRDPYKDGGLGEISEGAYADLILVDGNPLEEIDLISDPDKNFLLIMKDGVVYKNIID